MKRNLTAEQVKQALSDAGFGGLFSAIDDNPMCPGEVVLWAGGGIPVYSIKEALRAAREEDEARYGWLAEAEED